MRASRVRVVAPIPGKAAVGIEIPNDEPSVVTLRGILESRAFQRSPSKLTLALGQTIDGQPFVADLAEMPHLLVAGATGSGKSVCLNSIITSILYRADPTEVKLVLIDPKKLELNLYRKLHRYHLATREDLNEEVITTVENAVAVLRSLELEMERRYRLLAGIGVRNIDDYNRALKEGGLPSAGDDKKEKLPYIVIVVDELADLMVMGAREIEEPISRLAQMSRAVGIHLILATQRPSVDVITGVIKANFPSRIAFQVAAKTDSRTILDRNGADKLLGRGDMLFLHPREPEPIRLHGAFVSAEEVRRVVAHVTQQPKMDVWKLPGFGPKEVRGVGGRRGGDRDELFLEAAKLVIRHQQGSASLLQRRLRIGYARAGRLIDQLEEVGILGPFDGSKAREVLVDENYLANLQDPDFLPPNDPMGGGGQEESL
jgi:S-DNA-T family DNA segregation ATPase FtsK/SpoIIIE